jgi:hypothetical protein
MIDTKRLLDHVDLVDVVGREVPLKKQGSEWVGCCPFHDERTPSFHVVPAKGFVHCFGCGVHYDAIGYVMAMYHYDFAEACRKLGGQEVGEAMRKAVRAVPTRVHDAPVELWVPVYPVPEDAPAWVPGVRGRAWNVKQGRWWDGLLPTRADAYRAADGSLMGYVLRVEFPDKKITPAVTWCIGPTGEARWCLQPFPEPRPLCGLDALASRPDAPVLVVEGEKCRAASAGALPGYVSVTWPGGSKGVRFVDFAPLAGRDVVLWPDADDAGFQAMLGHVDGSGLLHDGVAQLAHRAGARSLRVVDVSPQPRGWDIADALADGWTPRQLAGWAKSRVRAVEVQATGRPAA